MRHLTKFLTFSIFLLLVSCKKEETTSADFAGTWNLTAITCDDGVTTTTDGADVATATYKFNGKDYNVKVVFKDDKTYTSSGSYTQVLTTTVLGQTFTQEFPSNAFSTSGTWAKTSTTLTFTDSQNNAGAYEILEETDVKVRMKYALNSTKTEPTGEIITQKATIFVTMTR